MSRVSDVASAHYRLPPMPGTKPKAPGESWPVPRVSFWVDLGCGAPGYVEAETSSGSKSGADAYPRASVRRACRIRGQNSRSENTAQKTASATISNRARETETTETETTFPKTGKHDSRCPVARPTGFDSGSWRQSQGACSACPAPRDTSARRRRFWARVNHLKQAWATLCSEIRIWTPEIRTSR